MSIDPPAGAAAPEPTPESVFGHEEFAERALLMARSARQEVLIFSHDLDRRVYGSEFVARQLRAFLLEHRRGRLRALVQAPRGALQGSHRLVELARVLSSRMELRECAGPARSSGEEYVIVDQRQLLIRSDRYDVEARYYADAALLAREQQRHFDLAWQASPPSRDFAELRL